MNITETVFYDKDGHIEDRGLWRKLFLSLVILLVGLLGYGLGRLSSGGEGSETTKIEYDPSLSALMNTGGPNAPQTASAGKALTVPRESANSVIASKNGTKYHFPHCAGAKQIKEENKLIFNSPEAAEASGYTLAGNCQPR